MTFRNNVIAFIGLGQMGLPMAVHLLEKGFSVQAYDTVPEAIQAAAAAGASASSSVREACGGAHFVIAMLPNGTIVRNALMGGGVQTDPPVLSAHPGAIIADMSSSAPFGTRSLGKDLADLGFHLIDAPVSGGVKRARSARLTIMAGGEAAHVAAALPVLKAMGSNVVHVGALGAGHAVKALNNYVSAAGLAAACEAVEIGRAFGLDPEVMVDVLNTSTGKNNSTEVKMKPFVLSGAFNSGFAMALMAKDISIAADLARELKIDAQGLEAAAQLWAGAFARLGPAADHTAIAKVLARPREADGSGA